MVTTVAAFRPFSSTAHSQVPPLFRDLIDDFDDDHSVTPHMFLDVPFVPSDDEVIEAMLELAGVGSKDLLYDLGAGDGRIVVAAAKHYGARCVGVEIDPLRIADAMEYAGDEKVEYQVDFVDEDLFTVDFSPATVVTLYLLDSVNAKLRPRLLDELRPGARIVSHAFDMGDWQADEQIKLNGTTLYKWVVPAKVSGTWEWEDMNGIAYRVELEQKYQKITGSAWVAEETANLKNTKLNGDTLILEIELVATESSKCFTLDFERNELKSIQEG